MGAIGIDKSNEVNVSKIALYQENRKKIADYLKNLKNQFLTKKISYEEYQRLLHIPHEGKTAYEWLRFYEDKVSASIRPQIDKKAPAKKVFVFSIALIALFFAVFFLGPRLVGFATFSDSEQFSENLDLVFEQTEEYIWNIENPGKLNQVKLFGKIIGDGRVKVYLDDKLILDSNFLEAIIEEPLSEDKGVSYGITGMVINEKEIPQEEETNEIIEKPSDLEEEPEVIEEKIMEQPIVEKEIEEKTKVVEEKETITKISSTQTPFSGICEETCDLSGLDWNKELYTIRVEIENSILIVDSILYSVEQEETKQIEEEIVETNITEEISFVPAIYDAQGNLVKAKIKILDAKTKEVKFEDGPKKDQLSIAASSKKLDSGLYDVEIEPQENVIKKIELKNVNLTQNVTELIKIDDSPESGDFIEVYAIDPGSINFVDALVTVTATGNQLSKCKDWNFTEQKCYGDWIILQDIIPGQNYTFTLTPEDPGFGETNLTRYYLHDEADIEFTNYKQLKLTPNDTALVETTVDLSAVGIHCFAPNWTSPNYTSLTNVGGVWNFSIYGYCNSNKEVHSFARIFKLNSTGRFNIANTTQSTINFCEGTVATPDSWNYNLSSVNLSIGERVGIQLCLNIVVASNKKIAYLNYEGATPSNVQIPIKTWDPYADINLTDHYALNSSQGRVDTFNTTNLEEIEYMVLNFSLIADETIDSWHLNFTANGTRACSLGNKQSSVCYNYSNTDYKWIQFINGTETATFKDEGSQGNYILQSVVGSGNQVNVSFKIDEHYNPNVFKWYNAEYDFNDVKWQNATNVRITGDNVLKIELNQSLIPLDADQYKLDFRVDGSAAVENLDAYACNSSYVSGNIHNYSGCTLIAEKLPSELQDDGTKFRMIFTQELINGIGNIKYIVLGCHDTNESQYYAIKTYNATAPSYTTHWQYSNDHGDTWDNPSDGYETELNINWFYDGGTNPTTFVYKFWANTTSGSENSLEGNITWNINPTQNYPPLATIFSPFYDGLISLPHNITFNVVEPNGDNTNVSIHLYNASMGYNKTLVSEMNQSNSSYYWADSTPDGDYNLVVEACELGTTELYCRNDTHYIILDNTGPAVFDLRPLIGKEYNLTSAIEIAANATDNTEVQKVIANITFPNGAIQQLTLNNSIGDKYNNSFAIPFLKGQYNITIIANDSYGNKNNTEKTYFILNDVTPPRVQIVFPLGDNLDGDEAVPISLNISDLTGIDTIIANITSPNSTVYLLSDFSTGLPSDNFETDTEGTNWVHKNETSASQDCFTDIDGTVPGKMFISVDGGTGPSTAHCAFNSLKRVDGNYDLNLTYNITYFEEDSFFTLRSAPTDSMAGIGIRVYIAILNQSGQIIYRFAYNNGTTTTQQNIPNNETYGKLRIKRFNMTGTPVFNMYYWNTTSDNWIDVFGNISLLGSARTQFIQIKPGSEASGFGRINVTVDDFFMSGDNFTFALFNQTSQNGRYNVTIRANDTLGYVNDSESTYFNISGINNAPSRPFIEEPDIGEIIGGLFNISWGQVVDQEGDSLQFNITLLNPGNGTNATIVSNYGNASTTYYQWNTSQHSDGYYSLRVLVFENETEDRLSNLDTLGGNFTIDNSNPLVSILSPLNETYNTDETVLLELNITDIGDISTIIANITSPNSTTYIVDDFISVGQGIYNTSFNKTSQTGRYNISFFVNDTLNHINNTETTWFNVTVGDAQAPSLTNFQFRALNSSKAFIGTDETSFNTTNLEEIEFMNISFTLTDTTGIFGDIVLYFTANGTNGCSLGNKQSSVCYNNTNWIVFKNGTETSTFKDEGNIGDYISCSYQDNVNQRNYSCIIDEHYNPNVFKWYDADYNFSDVKWQDGVDQRITKTNMVRVMLKGLVPLDADQYKLDFRVQAVNNPTQPLEAYGCNTSYVSGDPAISPECKLIAQKLPSELQDDGTKFRGIFTKHFVDEIGDGKYIVLKTNEQNQNKYYSIKTYKALNLSHEIKWEYSTNTGTSWINNSDGYESEMNINWFYNGADPTKILMKIWSNDTLGNEGNSSIQNMTWDINANQNYPPLVSINFPEDGANITGITNINWTAAEPNEDNYTTNVTANNGTTTIEIATNLGKTISSTTWDTSNVKNGYWNITVESCENETTELYCGNSTHQVLVYNSKIKITYLSPISNKDPNESSFRTITFNATVYDENGFTNINMSSVIANFTRNSVTREGQCNNLVNYSSDYANFSCSINMWYFDSAGDWNITVYAEDNSAGSALNTSTWFQYNQLISIVISPDNLAWAATSGSFNQTSNNDPTILNNTGNANLTIQINATNLHGETDNNQAIFARNISAGISTGGSPPAECLGTTLNTSQYINITDSNVNPGNLSIGGGVGQEEIYYCIKEVGFISTQIYSTQQEGSWTVRVIVLLAALIIRRKKKKHKAKNLKEIETDNLANTVSLVVEEIKNKYNLGSEETLKLVYNIVKKKYNLDDKQAFKALGIEKEQTVPITIFTKDLGALECLVKYMKEELGMNYHNIAKTLNRDDRTIWTTYKKANKKIPGKLKYKETNIKLPLSIYNRKLTILESIIMYLKEKGLKFIEIAKLLDREQRNIWTIYNRARKK